MKLSVFSWFNLSTSNLGNYFRGSARDRELSDSRELYERVRDKHARSSLATAEQAYNVATDLATEACRRAAIVPSLTLAGALHLAMWEIQNQEGIIGLPEVERVDALTMEEGVAFREYLRRKERYLWDHDRLFAMVREHLTALFAGVLGFVPQSVLDEADDEEPGPIPFSAPLIDLCERPRELIASVMATMAHADVVNAHVFDPLRAQLESNLWTATGVPTHERQTTRKQPLWPMECRVRSDAEVVSLYLSGTPFERFLKTEFPFHIPFPARFEHTHVVGGTGHGKTQLLQLLIHHDLMKSQEDGRSVVVIDSQGDLIRTISHLGCFSPEAEKSLADRLVLVDPTDIEYPACLNMFDVDRERFGCYSALEREKILNATIDLYEYFFGALLGAELTQKQGVIFKYLARLMLEIPGATVHTFRQLMENGEPFRPYMQKLPPSARSFFETRFFDRSFNETKKQVLTRLWGVLSNATFERMFSHKRNKVDLFDAMNSGKVVLINTAKDLLQQDGSAIFGRFFIALIAQAAIRRSAIAPHERRPTFVYVDEAADYFDDSIERLLNQARKFKVGMVLAHQNLDQLSSSLRSSIFASTSIKLAGGVSAKDASAFATEMQCDAELIQGMKKRQGRTAFACYVRNLTPHAIGLSVPLGSIEALPTMSAGEYAWLVGNNRRRYCAQIEEIVVPEPPAAPKRPSPVREEPASAAPPPQPQPEAAHPAASPEPPPARKPRSPMPESAPLGRGGRKHKYLQQLFKQLAEERGFRAIIEEPILDGAGKVDLALVHGELRIACEISVTTGKDHELANIEKCLAAGYSRVVLVSAERRYLTAMQKFVSENLEPADSERVRCLAPEDFVSFLDELGVAAPAPHVVRGYKVSVTREVVSADEAEARRTEIAKVIARSLRT